MKIRILGCGTSSGVPRIGNDWGACDPADPRNRRTRVSALVSDGATNILIDTGPDMREQLLAAGVSTVDAVLWTHDHADHTHGIDDLRQVFHARRSPVPGFARPETLASLRGRFEYIFDGQGGYRPVVDAAALPDRMTTGELVIRVIDQPHGDICSAGLRFEKHDKSIGYATDFSAVTPDMVALYKGCDVLVVDALRETPHPTHPNLSQALSFLQACEAKRGVLIHMDQSLDYATLARTLPPHVVPGHDGLEIAL